MYFNKIFKKNGTYDDIKSDKKNKTLHSLQRSNCTYFFKSFPTEFKMNYCDTGNKKKTWTGVANNDPGLSVTIKKSFVYILDK